MADTLETIIYPVRDLAAAKALYGELLGVPPVKDEPYYVGFDVDGHRHVGLDPHGHRKGMTGPVPYWRVDDIAARLKALLDAGAQPHQEITPVGEGRLIAMVKDADGNLLGLLQDA